VSRKGCLGCSFPVLIIIIVAVLVVGVVSFLSGAVGKAIVGDVGLPEVFSVGAPHVQLPAEEIFHIGGFAVTNTLIASWVTIIVLVGFAWAVTHRIKLIPTRLQNVLEFALEWLLNFCVDVVGEKNGRRFFPVITTIFLFVMINAWLGLVPGFNSITYTVVEHGETHVYPLLRGANTDINFALALALISFVFVEYLGIRENGFGYFARFISVSGIKHGLSQLVHGQLRAGLGGMGMGVIQMAAGGIEALSEFVRIVSFSFRLFGNMIGGEILILVTLFLVPWLVGVLPYGLELFVGLVQALIFGGLTLAFAAIAITPREH